MKRIALLVMLLFITVNLVAQDSALFTGSFWIKLTHDSKAFFIIIMAQGEWAVQKRLRDMGEDVILENITNKIEDKRNINDIISGIDEFYAGDVKRLDIPIALVYMMLLDASRIE